MEHKTKRRSILRLIAISFAVFCMFIVGSLTLLVMTATVSGSAALPNGTTATINGPFSCSSNSTRTEIEAGGHVFVFSPTTISIDGTDVAPLDETVTDVQINASYWTASLVVNGNELTTH